MWQAILYTYTIVMLCIYRYLCSATHIHSSAASRGKFCWVNSLKEAVIFMLPALVVASSNQRHYNSIVSNKSHIFFVLIRQRRHSAFRNVQKLLKMDYKKLKNINLKKVPTPDLEKNQRYATELHRESFK